MEEIQFSKGAESVADFLQIPYTRTIFTLQFMEDTQLPEQKVSMIRGGLGEMFLLRHCVNRRICSDKKADITICDYAEECLVQRMMYAEPAILPKYMNGSASLGYIIECPSRKMEFTAGEELTVSVLLFGKNIVYFNEYAQAMYALGQQGMGKNMSRFAVTAITNQWKQPILSGNDILMEYYRPETIASYVQRRMSRFQGISQLQLQFTTPLIQKFRGELLRTFQEDALKEGLQRRIQALNCLKGEDRTPEPETSFPKILSQKHDFVQIPRYSFRNREKIFLKGITGTLTIEQPSPEWLALLCAGELVHVGKSVTFGCGKYRVKEGE